MVNLLLIRGLERQTRGDPTSFLEAMRLTLSAARTTVNRSTTYPTYAGRGIEQRTYMVLDRWLERLDGHPELLTKSLQIIRDHEAQDPYDPKLTRLAQQVFVANAIGVPGQWMPQYLDDARPGSTSKQGVISSEAEVESNLLSFAWAVPWERERHRRIVGLGNVPGNYANQCELLQGLPGGRQFGFGFGYIDGEVLQKELESMIEADNDRHRSVEANRRATLLKLAIRQFELGEGRVPQKLQELVPKYLPKLPGDPFSKSSFRYRISAGETIPGLKDRESELPAPPPGANFSGEEYQALAGAFGGAVCWPLLPDWLQAEEPGGPFGSVPIDWERLKKPAELDAQNGQPILWSVGPDRIDDRGMTANPRPTQGQRGGDLVYVVPRRP